MRRCRGCGVSLAGRPAKTRMCSHVCYMRAYMRDYRKGKRPVVKGVPLRREVIERGKVMHRMVCDGLIDGPLALSYVIDPPESVLRCERRAA